jgi:hypothetical protein
MGRTRRSGHAGEALPLQFHIAGPHRGVGALSRKVHSLDVPESDEIVYRISRAGRSGARPQRSLRPQSPIDNGWRRASYAGRRGFHHRSGKEGLP